MYQNDTKQRAFLQKNGKNNVLGTKLAICDQFS